MHDIALQTYPPKPHTHETQHPTHRTARAQVGRKCRASLQARVWKAAALVPFIWYIALAASSSRAFVRELHSTRVTG